MLATSAAIANDGGIMVYKATQIITEKKDGNPVKHEAAKVIYGKIFSETASAAIKTFTKLSPAELQHPEQTPQILHILFKEKTADGEGLTKGKLDIRTPGSTANSVTEVVPLVFDSVSCTSDSNRARKQGTCELYGEEAKRIFNALPGEMSVVAGHESHVHGMSAVSGYNPNALMDGASFEAVKSNLTFSCRDAVPSYPENGNGTEATWTNITPECSLSFEQRLDSSWIMMDWFGDWDWWVPSGVQPRK